MPEGTLNPPICAPSASRGARPRCKDGQAADTNSAPTVRLAGLPSRLRYKPLLARFAALPPGSLKMARWAQCTPKAATDARNALPPFLMVAARCAFTAGPASRPLLPKRPGLDRPTGSRTKEPPHGRTRPTGSRQATGARTSPGTRTPARCHQPCSIPGTLLTWPARSTTPLGQADLRCTRGSSGPLSAT